MTKEELFNKINESVTLLMDSVEEQNGPYRFKDLRIFIYILRSENSQVMMSELSDYLNITPAAVSQLVQKYENSGYLKRVRSQEDRRKVYIQVEEEVKENILKEWQIRKEKFLRFLDYVGDEDGEAIYRVLNKLYEFKDLA
ncbi:MAG: MarR family transcriptional regulator [Firmicutes bacterium]|nr:MarR family transcriptional regulator [Bacillota bacterium]